MAIYLEEWQTVSETLEGWAGNDNSCVKDNGENEIWLTVRRQWKSRQLENKIRLRELSDFNSSLHAAAVLIFKEDKALVN